MALTKKDIVEKVRDVFERAPKRVRYSRYNRYNTYTYQGLTKGKCVNCVESLIEIMGETLGDGEDVLISGFGKFCVKHKKARMGRNPATSKRMMLKKDEWSHFNVPEYCERKSTRDLTCSSSDLI